MACSFSTLETLKTRTIASAIDGIDVTQAKGSAEPLTKADGEGVLGGQPRTEPLTAGKPQGAVPEDAPDSSSSEIGAATGKQVLDHDRQ